MGKQQENRFDTEGNGKTKRRKRTKKEENIEEINITVDESNKNKLK